MGSKIFIPKSNKSYFAQAKIQQRLIEKNYDFFQCNVFGNKLICKGKIKPSEKSEEYTIKIDYDLRTIPKVYVINPRLEYNQDIHMYEEDKRLCLYYPKENPWSNKKNVYDTIIPWTAEWLVYYELYKLYGKWLGKSQSHSGVKVND